MAQTRWTGAGFRWPKLTMAPAFERAAPTLANLSIGAAAAARLVITGTMEWATGGTHDIQTIHFRMGASTLSGTLRVYLADPSTSAGPPGRDDGVVDQFATQVNPTGATNYSLTLDANRTVAQGGLFCCVFDYSAYTSGAAQPAMLSAMNSADWMHRPVMTLFDGTATYTVQGLNVPIITFEASDGTFGQFQETYPRISAAVNSHAINTGTTPDEVALAFTVPAPCTVGGMGMLVQFATAGDFDLVLYEGTSALQTATFVSDTLGADATVRWASAKFPDTALSTGTTYYLALKPSTANSVTAYSIDCSASGHLQACFGTQGFSSRTDAGAWAATTATRWPVAYLDIVSTEAAGGGGGRLVGGVLAG